MWADKTTQGITGGGHAARPPRTPMWAITHITLLKSPLGHPAWTMAENVSVAIGRTAGRDAGSGVPAALASTAD